MEHRYELSAEQQKQATYFQAEFGITPSQILEMGLAEFKKQAQAAGDVPEPGKQFGQIGYEMMREKITGRKLTGVATLVRHRVSVIDLVF